MKKTLVAGTLGLAGLVGAGLLALPITTVAADDRDDQAFAKREDSAGVLVLAADDNRDDNGDDGDNNAGDLTRGGTQTRTRDHTRDHSRHGDHTRDNTRDHSRDLTHSLDDDHSRHGSSGDD